MPNKISILKPLLLSLLSILIAGCRYEYCEVRETLKQAGDNSQNLEAVLLHFKDRPMELSAATYIIKNMKDKYSYCGETLDSIKQLYNHSKSLPDEK